MSKVNITQACKSVGISRSQMYKKYINTGLLTVESIDGVKQIDVSELIRVFGNVELDTVEDVHSCVQEDTNTRGEDTQKDKEIIEILKQQLKLSQDREKWLMEQLENATNLSSRILENKESAPKRKKIFGIF